MTKKIKIIKNCSLTKTTITKKNTQQNNKDGNND
jgi:hypothetical protein